MIPPTEGTVLLDGLVEGSVPDDGNVAGQLREWVAQAHEQKMSFELEIDGGRFSLLASRQPIQADQLPASIQELLSHGLGALLELLPKNDRAAVCSTLRSMEYDSGKEVQTLYAIGPDGKVQTQQRTVRAETTPRPEKITRRDRIRLALTGLAIAAVVIAVSTFFVDYRRLYYDLGERLAPTSAADMTVQLGSFDRYFSVADKTGGGRVKIVLARKPDFPKSAEELEKLAGEAKDVPERLTVEALARGYIRCEYFDRENNFMGCSWERIAPLAKDEKITLELPTPGAKRVGSIRICY